MARGMFRSFFQFNDDALGLFHFVLSTARRTRQGVTSGAYKIISRAFFTISTSSLPEGSELKLWDEGNISMTWKGILGGTGAKETDTIGEILMSSLEMNLRGHGTWVPDMDLQASVHR